MPGQVVVFLYLLDNETSFVILASSGVGLLIEFWKVTKAMDVSIDRSGRIPRLRFKDKQSYTCALFMLVVLGVCLPEPDPCA